MHTDEEIIKTLREIVASMPDGYRYPVMDMPNGCVYSHDGEPSCLLGHLLQRLEPEMFKSTAKLEESEQFQMGFPTLLSRLSRPGFWHRNPFTQAQVLALGRAQGLQDDGNEWDEAVDAAERALIAIGAL